MKSSLRLFVYYLPDSHSFRRLLPWDRLVHWSSLMLLIGLMGGGGQAQNPPDGGTTSTHYSPLSESSVGIDAPESVTASDGIELKASTGEQKTLSQWLADPEYAALVDLYTTTNGSNWLNNNNWLTASSPCNWYGVSCTNGRVTQLVLRANRLSGSIPASLSALTKLEYLYLYNNQLSGTIPASLSALTQLRELSLYNNQLSGSIPSSLSALTKLQTLLLRNNRLSGCLPASLSVLCGRNVILSSNPGLPGGGDFAAFCANRTGQCPLQADLTLTLYARPSTIFSTSALISAVVEVVELNNVASSGPLSLKITKDALLELDFSISATEIGGKAVTNSGWTFSNADPDYYLLTNAQPVGAGGSQTVGMSGRLRPGASAGGLTLSAVLVGVEGEQKLTNNTDAEKIDYFPE